MLLNPRGKGRLKLRLATARLRSSRRSDLGLGNPGPFCVLAGNSDGLEVGTGPGGGRVGLVDFAELMGSVDSNDRGTTTLAGRARKWDCQFPAPRSSAVRPHALQPPGGAGRTGRPIVSYPGSEQGRLRLPARHDVAEYGLAG